MCILHTCQLLLNVLICFFQQGLLRPDISVMFWIAALVHACKPVTKRVTEASTNVSAQYVSLTFLGYGLLVKR